MKLKCKDSIPLNRNDYNIILKNKLKYIPINLSKLANMRHNNAKIGIIEAEILMSKRHNRRIFRGYYISNPTAIHSRQVTHFIYLAPSNHFAGFIFQDTVKPNAGASAVVLAEETGNIHFYIFFDNFVKIWL